MNCYRRSDPRLEKILDRIFRMVRRYPPALRRLGREWVDTLGSDPRHYVSAPDASPLLHLPLWLVEGRRLAIPERNLDAILEATALLYFHSRIQDNVLDEPQSRGQAPQLLLGNVFFLEAWNRLRALPLSDRFWTWTSEAWRIFSDATEAERRQLQAHTPYTTARFRRHARKVALARIPLYAVMEGESPKPKIAMDRFIDQLGAAYGLVNDVLGVERDLVAGMRTFLIATVEAGLPTRAKKDPATLRRELLMHPYLEHFLERAIALHRRIKSMGEALKIARMDEYTHERIELLRHHHALALGLRLRFALSGKP